MNKIKIIIAGIGGVGGYFGGKLANHFFEDGNVEISFIARGEHLRAIQKKGLSVIESNKQFISIPSIATDTPSDIGIADYIIISTKSYDLEAMIRQLQPCITQDTVILPLLNGVNISDRISKILPNNLVCKGCAYINADIKSPGVIQNNGLIQTLIFGLDTKDNIRLRTLIKLFNSSEINAVYSTNITPLIWEKFIFISSFATTTSLFNKNYGEILADSNCLKTLFSLILEIEQLAIAKQIALPLDIVEKTLSKLKQLPHSISSSLHADFINNNSKTELESLIGYVCSEGEIFQINMPVYKYAYKELNKENNLYQSQLLNH